MTIGPGSRLGPYAITAKLGEGAMGEVWRATDPRLEREVAIKVLPLAFTADPDRLARFEREAKLLAQLHHPNIASVFGLEESDGARALVMELVEGEDLSALVARGPVPVSEALAIARQIAEALEAAHERGIVHRDLKPHNVKLRADGAVKVLDFGLAKAMDASGGAASGSGPMASPTLMSSPTMTSAHATQAGMLLGSAAYMAPEQARGGTVDKRADIWAFGVVLFEMLTGRQLFSGETVSDPLAAVLRQDIDWEQLPPDTPAEVRRLLRRCLERDTKNRLHDVADARLVLQDVLAGRVDAPATPSAAAARPALLPRLALGLAAAGLVALLVAGWLVSRAGRRPSGAAQTARPVSFQELTDAPGIESSPSLAPDGKSFVYVGRVHGVMKLYLQRVGGRNATLLDPEATVDDSQPAFSPDGEQIAFRSERDGGGIFLMGSTGESVRRLTDFGFNPSWSPDGKEIVVANGNYLSPNEIAATVRGLVAVEVASGRRRNVLENVGALQPSWSPHGQRIAFWALRSGTVERDLFTVAADGSERDEPPHATTHDAALDWSPTWAPDGKSLWFSSDRGGTMNLWRLPIDEASGRPQGEPEAMTAPSVWSGEISFARDGSRVAYASLDWRSTLLRVGFDPRGERVVGTGTPILKSTLPIRDHELSPDGQWVVFMLNANQQDVAIARLDGSEYRRLTDDKFHDRLPGWSPDGREIAFSSDRGGGGRMQIWAIRADGSGLRQLVSSPRSLNLLVYAPDGRRMVIPTLWVKDEPIGFALADLQPGGPPAQVRIVRTPELGDAVFWPGSWSPDGKRLLGTVMYKNGAARDLAVHDLDNGRTRVVLREDGFIVSGFLSDGRRALFRDRRGVSLLDTATGAVKPLIEVGGTYIGKSVGASRDDRWITYIETGTEGDVWLAELR